MKKFLPVFSLMVGLLPFAIVGALSMPQYHSLHPTLWFMGTVIWISFFSALIIWSSVWLEE